MRKWIVPIGVALLLLAACAPAPPAPATAPPTATTTLAPTQTPIPSPTSPPIRTPPPTVPPTPAGPMTLTSTAFDNEGEIPVRYGQRPFRVTLTIEGEQRSFVCANPPESQNISPPLAWANVPPGTQSLVLTMVDDLHFAWPDLPPGATFTHWIVYNIPPTTTELPEGIGDASPTLPDGSMQAQNAYPAPYHMGYGGPCPPSEKHLYIFTLYALDTVLDLEPGARESALMAATEGHVLARAELRAYFGGG